MDENENKYTLNELTKAVGKDISPLAKKELKRLSTHLTKDMFHLCDGPLLRSYLECYDVIMETTQDIREHGVTVFNSKGELKANPAVLTRKQHIDLLLKSVARLKWTDKIRPQIPDAAKRDREEHEALFDMFDSHET